MKQYVRLEATGTTAHPDKQELLQLMRQHLCSITTDNDQSPPHYVEVTEVGPNHYYPEDCPCEDCLLEERENE